MSDARWERIKSVFQAAMECRHEERSAFLDRQCGGDGELRREVESLLTTRMQSVVRTGGAAEVMASATTATLPGTPLTERAGTVIGPYKILQQIGEGGFGTVFMAEQSSPVRRRVALKIIKLGMDTKAVVARFEAERQALALMDHPHIAKVLDAGATDSGRPFFVMEYVTGDAITTFCDAHKLGVRDRLRLFSQVCAAVQHAHTKGVIHRDIKPGNVLVSMSDGKPFAKVIDFGIAKATAAPLTERTLFTEHRQLIGTPEYMSPEQAEGSADIDTRTDVYALGVLLYELLSGLTPFDAKRLRSAAYAEMQRIIKEEEPLAPSIRLTRHLAGLAATAAARQADPLKLGTQLKGELDWIVMKAIDKDRARRYESPNQLAADVQRHLAGEAVVAAAPSAGYRVRKFVRRNKGPVLAGSAVVAALVLGMVGTTWQWRIAKAASADALAMAHDAGFNAAAADIAKERAQVQRDFAARIGRAIVARLKGDEQDANLVYVRSVSNMPEPVPGPYDSDIAKVNVGQDLKRLVTVAFETVGHVEDARDQLAKQHRELEAANVRMQQAMEELTDIDYGARYQGKSLAELTPPAESNNETEGEAKARRLIGAIRTNLVIIGARNAELRSQNRAALDVMNRIVNDTYPGGTRPGTMTQITHPLSNGSKACVTRLCNEDGTKAVRISTTPETDNLDDLFAKPQLEIESGVLMEVLTTEIGVVVQNLSNETRRARLAEADALFGPFAAESDRPWLAWPGRPPHGAELLESLGVLREVAAARAELLGMSDPATLRAHFALGEWLLAIPEDEGMNEGLAVLKETIQSSRQAKHPLDSALIAEHIKAAQAFEFFLRFQDAEETYQASALAVREAAKVQPPGFLTFLPDQNVLLRDGSMIDAPVDFGDAQSVAAGLESKKGNVLRQFAIGWVGRGARNAVTTSESGAAAEQEIRWGLAHARRVISVEPTDLRAWIAVALGESRLGNAQRAREAISKARALASDPVNGDTWAKDPDIRWFLARAEESMATRQPPEGK